MVREFVKIIAALTDDTAPQAETGRVSPSDWRVLLAGLIQLGPSSDGSVERDLVASIEAAIADRVKAERERCAQIADGFTCGACGMDGKVGAAIRALPSEKIDEDV